MTSRWSVRLAFVRPHFRRRGGRVAPPKNQPTGKFALIDNFG